MKEELKKELEVGIMYQNQNNISMAIESFNNIINEHPECIEAHWRLVQALTSAKEYEKAIITCKSLIDAYPNYKTDESLHKDFSYIFLGLGNAYFGIDDKQNGIASYNISKELGNPIFDEISKIAQSSSVKKQNSANHGKQKEGCYIATACYGSYETVELLTFRKFRDEVLRQTILGRSFIMFYYFLSPYLVKLIGNNVKITRFIKQYLDEFYIYLSEKNKK